MSKFIGIVVGALAITAGILIDIGTFGALTPLLVGVAGALLTAGSGLVLTGLGTLISGSAAGIAAGGVAWATRNPIAPWQVIIGRAVVGGTVVFINEFGDSDKYLDMVIVLASHTCQSVDSLLFDKQLVQLSTAGGTFTGIGDSFTPLQQTISVFHITRASNVVTCQLSGNIPLLNPGDKVIIAGITGDYTLNGRWPVSQILTRGSGYIVFTYVCGGLPAIVDNEGTCTTTWANYGPTVHMEVMLGAQALGTTFPGMLYGTANNGDTTNLIQNLNNPWTAKCSLVGKTAVFLRIHYDATVYTGGLPAISFMVHGKNDIYDPRLGAFGASGTTGYTENAALATADYLAHTTWGFKAVYGTEIPLAPLIAQANICDEDVPLATGGGTPYATGTVSATNGLAAVVGAGTAWVTAMAGGVIVIEGFPCTVASVTDATHLTLLEVFGGASGSALVYAMTYGGGTEPRYTCNGTFTLDRGRGEILRNLLTACAGRLTTSGGQFQIWAAAWNGSSPAPAPGLGSITAPVQWKSTVSIRDLYNGVKGTYISPSNNWHPSDIPPYAQDATHGYSGATGYNGDSNLEADGGDRRWLDMQLPFTISAATAQRLCKIELLRRRHQGTGTFRYNLVGYQFTAMDVIAVTFALFGWTGKTVEILAHRFTADKQPQAGGEDVTVLGTEIDVQETDASVYDWSPSEELTPESYQQPLLPNPFTPSAPTGLTLESNTSTASVTPSGIADSILVSWTPPTDGYVLSGGHIEVQYQEILSYLAGTATVTSGSKNVSGTGTAWTQAMVGGSFVSGGATYAIETVSSVTALIVATAFVGATAAQSYGISYQGAWIGLPSVDPSVTQVYIEGVDDAALYNVQIRSVNGAGFPSAWVSGSIIAAGSSRPLPIKPYSQAYRFAPCGLSFTLAQIVDNSGTSSIVVSGTPIVNVLSTAVAAPVIDPYALVTPGSGVPWPTGPFVAQVFPVDSAGLRGPGSNFTQFNISAAGMWQVAITVNFAGGTAGYEVFIGTSPATLVGQGYAAGTPTTITITIGCIAQGYGPPDAKAVAYHVVAYRVVHGGIAEANVSSFNLSTSTIVVNIPSAPSSTTEFAGRDLILVSRAGLPVTQAFPVGGITANDTGTPFFTLYAGMPTHVAVGDMLLIGFMASAVTATSITDVGTISPYAPTGLTPHVEKGFIIWVLNDPTGAARPGDQVVVTDNSATGYSTTPWRVTPGIGTVFVVVEATSRQEGVTVATPNSVAPGWSPQAVPLASIPAAALGGYIAIIQVFAQDAFGNDSEEMGDGFRMIYVLPTVANAGYFQVPIVAGVGTINLANGLTQILTLPNDNSTVTIIAPAGAAGAGFVLMVRTPATQGTGWNTPLFTGGAGGFATDLASGSAYITSGGLKMQDQLSFVSHGPASTWTLGPSRIGGPIS